MSSRSTGSRFRTILKWAGIGLIVLLLVIQIVPYGRSHTNPPVQDEPSWNSPETQAFVEQACYDCHSNETEWPWYSHIAPASWLVQRDVDEAREALNFTEWPEGAEEADEAAHEVEEGEMPMAIYAWLHSEARLDETERQRLIRGLEATFGTEDDQETSEESE